MDNSKIVDAISWWIPNRKLRNAFKTLIEDIYSIIEKIGYILYKLDEQSIKIDRSNNVLSDMILHKDKEKIFYLQTPEHGNIGDHAIVYASQKLLGELYPNKVLIEYTYNDFAYVKELIEKFISDEDIIFLPGGGNMGNLYTNEEILRRYILKRFIRNKVIVFPVSITFTDDDEGRKELEISQEVYNAHSNLTIFTRDKKSYEIGSKYFYNNKIFLMPDIVLYLAKYIKENSSEKMDSVVFILRKDKEKKIDDYAVMEIKNYLENKKVGYLNINTYIDKNINKNEREKYVTDTIDILRSAKLCITDRFHGMIFSFLANTPCIVLKSLDHKIEYGVKWFDSLEWINYICEENMYEIKNIIDRYLEMNNDVMYKNDIYFEKIIKDAFSAVQCSAVQCSAVRNEYGYRKAA